MKPIIFCNIANMKYYNGINKNDKATNGGAYVKETGQANEEYNFDGVTLDNSKEKYCLGYVRISRPDDIVNCQLHIEKIDGCQLMKDRDSIDGVTVVWCAKTDDGKAVRVVGWYKSATVFRYAQNAEFENGYVQEYNFLAKKEDCVLLPIKERNAIGGTKWFAPRHSSKVSYGFGRSNVWYAQGWLDNQNQKYYLDRIIKQIDEYDGENWVKGE